MSGPVTASFKVANDWGSGFTGSITITNTGASAIDSWQIEIDTTGHLTGCWNSSVVSQVPGQYILGNDQNTGHLAPGASITIGFNMDRAGGDRAIVVSLAQVDGVPVGTPPTPATPPSVSVAGGSVTEGGAGSRNEVFTLSLSSASTTPVTVAYATADSTARAGLDYDAATGTVTFAPGQTSATVSVPTHAGVAGSNLTFALNLSSPSGATIATAQATGAIANPAAPVTSALATATFTTTADWGSGFTGTITITNTGTTSMTGWQVEIDSSGHLTGSSNSTVVSQGGGKTILGNDQNTGHLAAGASVTVVFNMDRANGDRAIAVSLAQVNGVPVGTSPTPTPNPTPVVPPTIAVVGGSVNEGAAGSRDEVFTLSLSATSATPVTVAYATTDGTARAGLDYDAASGIVTFAPGQTSATVSVPTHAGAAGSNLAFALNLSSPSGATIATAQATGAIINPAAPVTPPAASALATATFTTTADWGSGFTGSITITNTGTAVMTGWQVEIDATGHITGSSNSTVVSQGGSKTVLGNDQNTGRIAAGASITVVFNMDRANGDRAIAVSLAQVNGVPVGTSPTPTPVVPASISVLDVTVHETTGTAAPSHLLASGYLSTSGNQIIDSAGNDVRITGVNWFGLETATGAPHGLWAANYKTMMDSMVASGFNTIRLPFALSLLHGEMPQGINYQLNPDLQGLTGMQIMDKVVTYAGQIGLKILLDNHRSAPGGSGNADGLWYDSGYTDANWVADWTALAQHYAGNSTVVGADLANEPFAATWGDDNPATDWRLAAERAGDAIQTVNPNLLIVVEGTSTYQGSSYWYGGNLQGVANAPVVLTDPNKLVYSAHDYGASVYNQSWFSAPDYPANLPQVWDKNWGFIEKQGLAPVLVGEFGTMLQTTSDQLWLKSLTDYMDGIGAGAPQVAAGQQAVSWTFWAWNPDSGDTGGIATNDWVTPDPVKLAALRSSEYVNTSAPVGLVTAAAVFTVTLSRAATSNVTVHYTTADGTAHAGTDYVANSGDLNFAPGVTALTVPVTLLSNLAAASPASFAFNLSGPNGASLATATANGILYHDATTPVTPTPTPTPIPSPPPLGVTAALAVTTDWGSGFTGAVTVTNNSDTAVNGWKVELDTSGDLTGFWNVALASHANGAYVLGNTSSNGQIAAHSSTSFGFNMDLNGSHNLVPLVLS